MSAGNIFSHCFMIVFGIVWTLISMSTPPPVCYFFPVFGILFIAMGAYRLYISVRRPEDVQERQSPHVQNETYKQPSDDGMSSGYCPYCGAPLSPGFLFCGVCGRRV